MFASYNSRIKYMERGEKMSNNNEQLIKETVNNLKQLDKKSLLIIKVGAEMLKSRDLLDEKEAGEVNQS